MDNQLSKIHVWLGYTTQDEETFCRYFEVNMARVQRGEPGSQFDKEVGLDWYDDDFIGVYYAGTTPNLAACLNELPTSAAVTEQIGQLYRASGLPEANAMFYYTNAELTVPYPAQPFNGLKYLGMFDW